MNADEFFERRWELPDAGRGIELDAGRIVTFEPPDVDHGLAILNLTKAFSAQLSPAHGYACFELGLRTARDPDTLRFPAISWFQGDTAFEESDKDFSENRPVLIVEVASSPDRRTQIAQRVQAWLRWGVGHVWVLDPRQKTVAAVGANQPFEFLAEHQVLSGGDVLTGFNLPVNQIFKEPEWWNSRTPRRE